MEWLWELWREIALYWSPAGSTRRVVMLGCTMLGISSGVLGSFALLRRQSLLGDAMAHAALPGICLAFLWTGAKHTLSFLVGATISGLVGAWLISTIVRHSRIKNDAAIGLVLSVFFGFGIVLLTVIQGSGAGNQSGLDTFLFGKAAFLLHLDLYTIGIMSALLLVLVGFFFKEFQLLSFDVGFGASLGFPMQRLDLFLTSLIVMSVMIGLQAVGVILMAALLIIPAAAARQWTERLGRMLWIAGAIGGLAGAVGAFLSTMIARMPTGPVMVLSASSILLFSLFFAPQRGLVVQWRRLARNRRRVQQENLLKFLYKTFEQEENWSRASLSMPQLIEHFHRTSSQLLRVCRELLRKGWLREEPTGWGLTEEGLERAREIVRNHRLWELYLTRKADIAEDHVHRDAEEMEHVLSPEIVAQLEDLLGYPATDPHGSPIPGRRTEGKEVGS